MSEISYRTLILGLGVSWRRLNVPGLEQLAGAGVFYGAARALSCKMKMFISLVGQIQQDQASDVLSAYAHVGNDDVVHGRLSGEKYVTVPN